MALSRSALLASLMSAGLLSACCTPAPAPTPAAPPETHAAEPIVDPHSHANTEAFRTQLLRLDLTVDFDARRLRGTAELDLARIDGAADTLVLDTRDLRIDRVEVAEREGAYVATDYELGAADPVLGSPLRIRMPAAAARVRITYQTSPKASGLQWLTPSQTAGKAHPFLFTQSQAIHARSWIPLQDTPLVRTAYQARIRTPKGLLAVMSAENAIADADTRDGDYQFSMPQPIPSYLIALAVGNLRFQATGRRTGVYAEPEVVKAAAWEFADTENMLERCEAIFGPYRWGRYDLLILPPSFPYGGMENPRLTFASPTVITGDRSLVSLVAHELAHSWSGNLVTNATWNDFWLNEGFTTHLTNRIMEEIYGPARGNEERAIGANDLKDTLELLEIPSDRTLTPDLAGRDPDDNVTDVPYEKGALFLAYLEAKFGRAEFDAFLRGWFDSHAFRSARTGDFLAYLERELLARHPGVVSRAKVDEWIHSPEIPDDAVWPQSDAFDRVDRSRDEWLGGATAASLQTAQWSTRQWQYFLDRMPDTLDDAAMARLDAAFDFSDSPNAIIASRWFRLVARHQYRKAYPAMQRHLESVGRMLLINPVYRELAATPEGLELAQAVFAGARDGYHPIARDAVEKILDRAVATPAP